MTITAKFAAACRTCGQRVTPGQQIEWSKGSPVRHTSCATHSGAPAAPTRGPRRPAHMGSYRTIGQRQQTRMDRTGWTGCRCGSIEGRPRDSDCAPCQHDY